MRITDRLPLTRYAPATTSLKKCIKICNPKLPKDFFGDIDRNLKLTNLTTSNLIQKIHNPETRENSKSHLQNRRKLQTPRRLIRQRNISNIETRRESYTARQSYKQDKQMNLIMSILQTNREMKKAIRKHSVELRKQSIQKKDDMEFQLPPLLLRKGITTAF